MVVLRLIGDQWAYTNRRAVAIKPTEPFKGRLMDIIKELDLESFVGYSLYRTEGNEKHVIRATIPIDLNSNVQKENLGAGAQVIVFVKKADLQQQSNDIVFHKGLLHYRKENGIKGVAKDGSDVQAYIADLSTRLNIDDSTDILEHEAQKRDKVIGEEHRAYWVLTFEFREIQALKDKEVEARDELLEEYRVGLSVGYTLNVKLPKLEAEESLARAIIAKGFDASYAALLESETKVRPKRPATPPPPAPPEPVPLPQPQQIIVAGGGMSKEDMDTLMTNMQTLIVSTQHQSNEMLAKMQTDFNSVVESLATDMRKSASEIQQLRTIVQGSANDEKAALLQIEMEATKRLEREREKVLAAKVQFEQDRAHQITQWMAPRNAEAADMAKRLLAEQNESLRSLIDEEDAMIDQQCQAMRSLAQGYELGLYSDALKSVAIDQSVQGMHLAQTQLAFELEHVTEHLRRLEAERAARMEEERQRDLQLQQEEQRAADLARAGRTTTVVTNGFCAVASTHYGIFGVEDVPSSTEGTSPLPAEVRQMLLLFIKTYAKPEELQYMVSSRDVALGIQSEPIDDGEVDALAASYLSALLVETGGSSFEINDQLVWAFSIPSHPHRSFFVKRLEDSHTTRHLELQQRSGPRRATPMDFLPFIDLFLALYEGREVELLLSICPELGSVGSKAASRSQWQAVQADESSEYYFYSTIPDLSQWERPSAMA